MSAKGGAGAGAVPSHPKTADTPVDPAALDAAHRELRADRSLQFDLPSAPPEPPEPRWIEALFEWLGDHGEAIFWTLLVLGLALVLYLLAPRIRALLGIRPRQVGGTPEIVLAPAVARALLRDADAVADQGEYGEAAHLLLLRSINALDDRRPQSVRPALTSRDLLGTPGLPASLRDAFAILVGAVERSLFAGRGLTREDWLRCREAYGRFAGAEGWA